MKIGIGITTFKREDCLRHWLQQLKSNQPATPFELHVAQNIPNISKAKNECLFNLRACDFIFLFDDDCFPKQPRWDMPFINSGYQHLLYMTSSYKPLQELSDVTRFEDCSGCFMFMTKQIFDTVGYFNTAYDRYGYEHIGYSHRIKIATKDWAYLSLNITDKYIHSLDLNGSAGYKVHHEKMTKEASAALAQKNKTVYDLEINSDKLRYEFE